MAVLRRISPPEFLEEALRHTRDISGVPTYGDGANHEPDFFFLELIGKETVDTKTFYQDRFLVNAHCIAKKQRPTSSAQMNGQTNANEAMLTMVGIIESVMANKIHFEKYPFQMASQQEIGFVSGTTDPTGEPHAVVQFEFVVRYGLKCK